MVIVVANQKGGCGKTTTAVNLAGAFSARGMDVLLVDADPQGSAMKWRGLCQGPFSVAVIALPMPVLDQELPGMAKKYDIVVVDTPPGMETITRSGLVVADLAIIPLQPSPLDLWSGTDIIGLVKRAEHLNPGLETRLLLNRKIQGTRLSRESVEALREFPYPLFATESHDGGIFRIPESGLDIPGPDAVIGVIGAGGRGRPFPPIARKGDLQPHFFQPVQNGAPLGKISGQTRTDHGDPVPGPKGAGGLSHLHRRRLALHQVVHHHLPRRLGKRNSTVLHRHDQRFVKLSINGERQDHLLAFVGRGGSRFRRGGSGNLPPVDESRDLGGANDILEGGPLLLHGRVSFSVERGVPRETEPTFMISSTRALYSRADGPSG